MYGKVKGFLDYVGSRRFAIALLVVTTSVILIGNLIPNPTFMSPYEAQRFISERPFLNRISNLFHVVNITRSPYFLVIPSFIVLSITVCTFRRFKGTRRSMAIPLPSPDQLFFHYSKDRKGGEDIRGALEKMGLRVAEREYDGAVLFYGRKGEGGIWGSMVFHLGMIVVIVGGIVSMQALFNGRISLTEGFPAEGEELQRGFERRMDSFPYQGMMLESFEAVYKDQDFPVDYRATLKTVDKKGVMEEAVIRVNQPLKKRGFSIILERYSFTPRFVITEKKEGKVILDAYVNLMVPNINQTDQMLIPDTEVRVNARFSPDFYKDGKTLMSRSMELKNPVFILEFFKKGEKLGDGILPLNKRMDFDGGRYSIEFRDLKKWVVLSVARDPGLQFVESGLLLVVIGLVIRFFLNEERVWAAWRKDTDILELGGKSLYFPALFDERLKLLAKELGFDTGGESV